ncbi:MAG TPA: DNA-directed RNA polymerase subunit omega [Pyrinomonadaceae bacterium]|nr:DNA-directed RNA polymerase subunit omega [Pyrinomonadaceae bacterium]
MSELQKVGDELAATSGHRSFSNARIVSRRQASIVRDDRNLIFDTNLANESLEIEHLMNNGKENGKSPTGVATEGTWPGIDSRFRLIIVAGLRTKQLLHGSTPRIEADKGRRRNTSIAVEEVKRGLVSFTKIEKPVVVDHGHGGGLD